jgi:hypothetical protein
MPFMYLVKRFTAMLAMLLTLQKLSMRLALFDVPKPLFHLARVRTEKLTYIISLELPVTPLTLLHV